MANAKRSKAKIKRRTAGLVITPPSPRPIDSDHPARLLFRDAIESEKASSHNEPVEIQSSALRIAPEKNLLSVLPPAARPRENPAAANIIAATPPGLFAAAADSFDKTEVKSKVAPKAQREKTIYSAGFIAQFGQWLRFLSESQKRVLNAMYEMTHALGQEECLTSIPKVSKASGVSERQTYTAVKELEDLGFIERPVTFNTATKKGTIVRLNRARRESHSPIFRRYQYED